MELNINQQGDTVKITIIGNVDERGAETLKTRFRELNVSQVKDLSFDFSQVSHIGSAGIGKLLLFYKDLAINGGKISVYNVSDSIYELFNVLKLDTIFNITKG